MAAIIAGIFTLPGKKSETSVVWPGLCLIDKAFELLERGRLFSSWPVLFGCHFFYFDPVIMNLFANEHKLVLVSGAEI